MTEGNESYVWLGSQAAAECRGCSELRKQVEDLRSMLTTTSGQQRDDDIHCNSTKISERKQVEIDKMLMDAHHKLETFQEAYEKALREKHKLLDVNTELMKQLEEKEDEVAVLKQQNAVHTEDFQLERKDRERSQSQLTDLQEQLEAASQRIAILEDERQHFLTTVTTTRHQNPSVAVYRGYATEPGLVPAPAYPEHHLPPYSSVCQPVVTHHSRQSPRSFGHDVCDS